MKNRQNKSLIRISAIAAAFIFISSVFQNCGKVAFSSSDNSNQNQQGTPGSCSTVISNYDGDLRIIIMVDNSGSTEQTDPQYQVRKQTVVDFITQYAAKNNFTYSFGEFANDQTSIYNQTTGAFVSSSSGTFDDAQINPFGMASTMMTALNTYVSTIPNGGDTPYNIAFNAITNVVKTDAAAGLTAPSYSVVFMSDGMPNPGASVPALQSYVQNVLNAAVANNNRLATVSTVYFGPETSANSPQLQAGTPENNLYEMSITGNGQFYNTNNPPAGGLIENVLTIPGQTQNCTQGN